MRVLVAIDGSEPASLAVELVAEAAWPAGSLGQPPTNSSRVTRSYLAASSPSTIRGSASNVS